MKKLSIFNELYRKDKGKKYYTKNNFLLNIIYINYFKNLIKNLLLNIII